MTDHPITPPPDELVDQWRNDNLVPENLANYVATQAARWGADQELEACVEHLKRIWSPSDTIDSLYTARRLKPPSLKEQALAVVENSAICDHLSPEHEAIIRRALEQLDD